MNRSIRTPGPWTAGLFFMAALAGCAHQAPADQTLEVRVEADSPAWAGPLACQASNAAGSWPFTAPGTVTVRPSTAALQITCQLPAGAVAQPSVTLPGDPPSRRERARSGAQAGAKLGAGAGVALGVAAVPAMGGAFAVLIAAGAAMKGGEIGGLVGAVRSGERNHYPSPVVLHVRSEPLPGSQ